MANDYVLGVDLAYCNDVAPTGAGAVEGFKILKEAVDFAYIKVSQGNDIFDAQYLDNRSGAKTVGLPWGAYHVYSPYVKYSLQYDWIRSHYAGDGNLPFCLDVEIDGGYSNAYLISQVNGLLELLKQQYKRVIIYTGAWWWNPNMTPSQSWMSTYDYFLASYPNTSTSGNISWEEMKTIMHSFSWFPSKVLGGKDPIIWQATGDRYSLPGIKGKLDVDMFKGNREVFNSWVGVNTPQPILTLEQRIERLENAVKGHGIQL